MRALGDYLGLKFYACVGGTSIVKTKGFLPDDSGVHVVVGTCLCL